MCLAEERIGRVSKDRRELAMDLAEARFGCVPGRGKVGHVLKTGEGWQSA